MSQVLIRIDNLGARNDFTAAVSGGAAVRVLPTSTANRQGINVSNNGAYTLWVKLVQSDTAPTISATSHDLAISSGDSKTLSIGGSIRCWVLSSDASNTVAGTAVEFL